MFDMVFRTTGLRWMHSTDLDDMAEAVLDGDHRRTSGPGKTDRIGAASGKGRDDRDRPARR
ncbi:hypothetical protein SAMN05444007_103157 [Cribrihabitans marinus]|uniref:Uncharacterized protein n=1 Tax=Cribrihabitans marinus TaxID=1227549 RepID=A0A1H6VD55_9RHOB|nr:hypothetical protein [Cribrihabitans marinus]GGH25935.1 hypothetical protein GCM10010973_13400 [Cribrihabitans marinus]SEJ02501.1 hypothetical protein SAMN05444007_103157 [Cribrihabitans marinus]